MATGHRRYEGKPHPGPPPQGEGRFVGWGLPHHRTTIAMRQTVRRGAPYDGSRA